MSSGYSNSSVDWSRVIRYFFVAIIGGSLVLYYIVSLHNAREYKKRDALEPHTRTYAEFAEVFNEQMAPQGIAMDESVQWDTSQGYARTVYCNMNLPDGSQVPCYVELWTEDIKTDHIFWLHAQFNQEQALYMEPIIQGVWGIFLPGFMDEREPPFSEIMGACKDAFGQQPYEKYWDAVRLSSFTLLSDQPDIVTVKWRFFSSLLSREY